MNTLDLRLSIDWRSTGRRYYPYSLFLRRLFGGRVQKVSLDGGFTCPNVDGKVATGGCVFCDNESFSPSRRIPRRRVQDQLAHGIKLLKMRYEVDQFLAYFQPGTNTYAPLSKLEPLFRDALSHPQVRGLVIGTRPDCLPDETLAFLAELSRGTYLSLELGMQTIHEKSLAWMNRGHDYACFVDALARCRERDIKVCTHVILGLPLENRDDMLTTADELARLEIEAVKIHNLYAVKGTPLGEWVEKGEVRLLEREEYLELLVDVLERLPPQCLVERISGETPGDFLIGPAWCQDKPTILKSLDAIFTRRDTWQGKEYDRRREISRKTATRTNAANEPSLS